jgi:chromosome segregation ATPase
MAIKIASVQVENVKRVKAVHLVPTATGLTVIGGKNGQGKTSVLDAIAWVLGGGKKEPSSAKRDGALAPPSRR